MGQATSQPEQSPAAGLRRCSKLLFLAPLLIAVAALRAGLVRPLWYDEALTLLEFVMLPAYGRIYASYTIPNNHIGYSLLLKLWLNTAGGLMPLVFSLRLFSLLVAVLAVAVLWFSLRRRYGPAAALLGSGLLALSWPMNIYGTAVRGYALSMFTGAVALYGILLLRDQRRVAVAVVCYSLAALLAVAVLPSNLVYFLALLPFVVAARTIPRWQRLLAGAIPVLGLLFYAPLSSQLALVLGSPRGWSQPADVLWHVLGCLLLSTLPVAALAGLGLSRLLTRWWDTRRLPPVLWLTLGCTAVPGLVLLAAGLLGRPAPFPRLFVIFWPAWLFLEIALCWEGLRLDRPCGLEAQPPPPSRPEEGNRRRRPSSGGDGGGCRWFVSLQHASPLLLLAVGLGWSLLIAGFRPQVAAQLRSAEGFDDLVRPYYVHDFHPEEVAGAVRELVDQQSSTRVVVTGEADPLSLLFAGRLWGLPDQTWVFRKPSMTTLQLAGPDLPRYAVAVDQQSLEEVTRPFYPPGRWRLIKGFGYQQLFERVAS